MTPHATRALVLLTAAALTLGAAASRACDRSAKTASAGSCGMKSTTTAAAAADCDVRACAGSAAMTASAARACAKSCARTTVTVKKAAPAPKAKPASATAAKKAAPSEAGMRAYRDPETGELTAAPAVKVVGEGPALLEAPDDLPQVPLPGGGYYLDLQGYGQEYAMVEIDAKGHRIFKCTTHPRAAKKSAAPVARTVPQPEK